MNPRRVTSGVRFEHLYVHVPFCARRCVYCDFSIAVRPNVPVDEYVNALAAEWSTRLQESAFELRTLYFGGGTPSKLGADGVRRVMDVVRGRATLTAGAEVTLEVNPEDVSPAAARAWRAAGVNRLSLGVQSFDDRVLTWMHRTHDAAGAERAIAVARTEGLENISIDLIFATPSSVGRDWSRDLDAALKLGVPHLSVYGLTVEPHTPLGRWVARDKETEAPEEAFAREFTAAHERLTGAGYEHYEVSNYSLPNRHSRHNRAYWDRAAYAGFGPSAHEFDGTIRRWNEPAYAAWVECLEGRGNPTKGEERLSADQVAAESVYLGLRTTTGIELDAKDETRLAVWERQGWARKAAGRVILTPAGWLRLDAIAADLTHLRSRY